MYNFVYEFTNGFQSWLSFHFLSVFVKSLICWLVIHLNASMWAYTLHTLTEFYMKISTKWKDPSFFVLKTNQRSVGWLVLVLALKSDKKIQLIFFFKSTTDNSRTHTRTNERTNTLSHTQIQLFVPDSVMMRYFLHLQRLQKEIKWIRTSSLTIKWFDIHISFMLH